MNVVIRKMFENGMKSYSITRLGIGGSGNLSNSCIRELQEKARGNTNIKR